MNQSNQSDLYSLKDFHRFACRSIVLKASVMCRQTPYTYDDLSEFESEFQSSVPFPWKLVICTETRKARNLDALLLKVSEDNISDHLDAPFRYSHEGTVRSGGISYHWSTTEDAGGVIIAVSRKCGD